MAFGISGNWWNTGRSSVTWGLLADTVLLQVEEPGPLAMAQWGKGSIGRVLWLVSRGVCFWPPDLGALVAPWVYPLLRYRDYHHSSTAVREELAVITGWQRWGSEIKISNDVSLNPSSMYWSAATLGGRGKAGLHCSYRQISVLKIEAEVIALILF